MNPVKIFYSYAHQDAEYRDELSRYLGVLEKNGKIQEWYDRKIEPGTDFNVDISNRIESADIVIFLLTENFLNSDYCFGVEVKKAFTLHIEGKIKMVPVLVKPCLFDESKFKNLQLIPRLAQPISTSVSRENAFNEVAKEIRDIVYEMLSAAPSQKTDTSSPNMYADSCSIVKQQITAYASLYERIRQLMQAGNERTVKMQAVFDDMKKIAVAAFPFLQAFTESPLPGERLAAVSILQTFASEQYFSFLADTIGSEKPFVGYQAAIALRFAVDAVDSKSYGRLSATLRDAKQQLATAQAGFDTDRYKKLQEAASRLAFNSSNLVGS